MPKRETYLKRFIFVRDAFGPIPMWSLQHPVKEAHDAYVINQDHISRRPPWLRQLVLSQQAYERIFKDKAERIHVDATVKWHYDHKYRVIDSCQLHWIWMMVL